VSYTLAFPLVYPGTLAHLRLAVTTAVAGARPTHSRLTGASDSGRDPLKNIVEAIRTYSIEVGEPAQGGAIFFPHVCMKSDNIPIEHCLPCRSGYLIP
jgi:hypothetical protein